MDTLIAGLIIAGFLAFVAYGEVDKFKAKKAYKEAQDFIKAKIADLEAQLASLRK